MTEPLFYHVLAGSVVIVHLAFVVFVVLGGLLLPLWPKIAWLHIPCVVWAVLIELTGGICPLTPLEVYLREQAGQTAYQGDFVMRYLEPVLYPAGLTRELQLVFSALVIVINAAAYCRLFVLCRKKHRQT